jgi:hypothetical protein
MYKDNEHLFGFMKTKTKQMKYFYISNNVKKEHILPITWYHSMTSCTPFKIFCITKRESIKRLNAILSFSIPEEIRVIIIGLLYSLDLNNADVISKQTFINMVSNEYGIRAIVRTINSYIYKNMLLDKNDIIIWNSILQWIDLSDEEYAIFTASAFITSASLSDLFIQLNRCFHSISIPCYDEFSAFITEIINAEKNHGLIPKVISKILEESCISSIKLFDYIC